MSPQSIDPGQQFTWEHSNLEVNKPKNRYANVIAYDHSRVILQPIEGSARGHLLLPHRVHRLHAPSRARVGASMDKRGDRWGN